MTTTNHLTPAELDALLEAARAATPGPWQGRFIYRLFRAARRDSSLAMHTTPEQDWPDSEFIAMCTPATITRLVLMVRELQQEREQLLKSAGEFAEKTYRGQYEAIEHFRARAVRALDEQRREAPLSQAATWSDAKLLIESLPLVETEEE